MYGILCQVGQKWPNMAYNGLICPVMAKFADLDKNSQMTKIFFIVSDTCIFLNLLLLFF